MIRIFRVNSGSCGACDLEIIATVEATPELAWAVSPAEADALLLTGPITAAARATVLGLLREYGERIPVVAVGRCAIDGAPFGRGGVAAHPDLKIAVRIQGCPVAPKTIVAAVRTALERQREGIQ
ncbi:MAG: NADH:ubiquinone oxidoreductase [Chloroflexi bacterium]|jgi:Ni,Fe-hydrogenase III small subunit|nr:NADH:ubiquinone oxidoreductase [Chloroflexota bacterium]